MYDRLHDNPELQDHFVKKEEYEPVLLDKYGRFPYVMSGHRDVLFPAVSAFLMESGYEPHYPEGKAFAVCLTHDIDSIRFPVVSQGLGAVDSMVNGRIGTATGKLAKLAAGLMMTPFDKTRNPARNFRQIIDLEKKYGAKSSFYFLKANPKDGRLPGYRFEKLREDLEMIAAEGWEIGLHGGHSSGQDLEQTKKDKDELETIAGREVYGYRNHYLRFSVPGTWEMLARAGLKYDTTFGYADCVGFRNGTCHPFRPYNLTSGKEIDIWELPLTIMENTLFGYMSLDTDTAWDIVRKLIDTGETYRGVITILWHNTSMTGETGEFYERILAYCREKNAWMTSGEEIWKKVSTDERS